MKKLLDLIKHVASLVAPRLLGWVPKRFKLLYPFYLAGQLHTVEDTHMTPALPAEFDGFTIAYASDIHYGPLFHREEALALFDRLVALQADLTVLGGDYGNSPENALGFFELIPPFPKDRQVVAVLGNHDYGPDWPGMAERLRAQMEQKNIRLLLNQTMLVIRGGTTLAVCGPEDIRSSQPDLEALAREAAEADFVLFIPHSPDIIPKALESSLRFHLALCGHTHGGQLVFFGRSLHSSSVYGDRYRAGWYEENGAHIHVSQGVGTSILPMRIGTRAQIHRLVLRRVA